MKTSQIRVNGYPPLDVVLQHFNALPILVAAVKQHCPQVLVDWDKARNLPIDPEVQYMVGMPTKGTGHG